MIEKPRHLLSGYATGILTKAERRQLMEAALSDQEVFDRLVEEETWRHVFAAPELREELRRELGAAGRPESFSGRIRRSLRSLRGQPLWRRPRLRYSMGALAAAVLAAVLLPLLPSGTVPGPEVDPAGSGSPASAVAAEEEIELTPKSLTPKRRSAPPAVGGEVRTLSYGLEVFRRGESRRVPEDYRFRPREHFRIRIETDFPAWVYLFNRAEGEDVYTRVYPASAEEHEAREGALLLPPDDHDRAGTLEMDDTPYDEQLVLLISTEPWSGYRGDRETVARETLEAELERAQSGLATLSSHRFVEDDRVVLRVARADAPLLYGARLLFE